MTINVPVSLLRDAANTLRQYTDENADLFDQILNMINSVESCGDWKGKSAKSLKSVTSANKKKFQQGMEELSALSDFLNRYLDSMTEEDLRIAQEIQNV